MNTITETPVKKTRERPAKKTTSNMEDSEQPMTELKVAERKGRGRPRLIRASSSKPKRTLTAEEIAEGRKQERAKEKQEYKAQMQKYLKERLKQGKAGVKLQNSIKILEAKMKAL